MAKVPDPGPGDLPGLGPPPGEEGDHGLGHRDQGRLGDHPHQVEQGVALEHGPQVVAGLHAVPVGVGAGRLAAPLPVPYAGGRGHHHPGAHDLGSPAEVDVDAVVAQGGVEPAEGEEEVAAHQHAGVGHGEHIAQTRRPLTHACPQESRNPRIRIIAQRDEPVTDNDE